MSAPPSPARGRATALTLGLAAALAASLATPRPARATATATAIEAALVAGIEQNFAGDWAGARATFESIRAIDPTHPAGWLFPVTSSWWEIALDPGDRRLDERIEAELAQAMELARARVEADPDDAEAWFYWGQSLGYLGRLHAERGRFYEAGAAGERGRKHLERALRLRPGYEDPKFALGSYYYFADLIPAALRWLSWLWFVPDGDREEGLRLLEEVRSNGHLNRLGAKFVLFKIYGRFEAGREDEALSLGRELRRRFPDNAVFHVEMVRLLGRAGHTDEALAACADVRARVRAGARTYDGAADVAARIWKARAELLDGRLDAATATLDSLAPLGQPGATSPSWARAWIELGRGQVLDLRGERQRAREAYERVEALERPHRDDHARREADRWLDEPFTLDPAPSVP